MPVPSLWAREVIGGARGQRGRGGVQPATGGVGTPRVRALDPELSPHKLTHPELGRPAATRVGKREFPPDVDDLAE